MRQLLHVNLTHLVSIYSEHLRIAVAIPGWAHVIALLGCYKIFPQLFQVLHSYSKCLLGIALAIPSRAQGNYPTTLGLLQLNL